MTSTLDVEYIYITLPDGYDVPMKGKVPVFFQKYLLNLQRKYILILS
ncbi:hypothetical protein NXW94_30390 [Bacteroides ovatus]|nr:hypothetical protein [Bacteroides ovatus]